MKVLALSLAAYVAAALFSLSPFGHARAETPMTARPAVAPGDWTLRQREDWVNDRLDKSRTDGSLDRGEYERARNDMSDLRDEEKKMRDGAHGQLTDNQTADMEVRLDAMAAKIHWANMSTYSPPW